VAGNENLSLREAHHLLRSTANVSNDCGEMWSEARHVTFDDVFIAQFGSASSTTRVIELAVEDIVGQATISHATDVAKPTQTSLPHDGDEVT